MQEETTARDRLSNKAEIVIRMLKMGISSKDIDAAFLDADTKDRLLELGLIAMTTAGSYILTNKAVEVVNTGGFIVKYPMTTEEGVVIDFNSILNGYSKEAAKALGLSIINTKIYRNWGRHNNVTLNEILKDTMDFYSSFDHVTTRLTTFQNRIKQAQSDYDKILDVELSKIKNFKLLNPITLGTKSNNGSSIILVELTTYDGRSREGIVGGSLGIPVNLNDPEYALTPYMKDMIIRQYHNYKSSNGK